MRLPWLAGLGALLLLAVMTAGLAGRAGGENGVVQAVLDVEAAAAAGAAQSVRRSLNEGSDDLQQVADALTEASAGVGSAAAQTALRSTAEHHQRYLGVGLADARSGRFLQVAGVDQAPEPLGELADDRRTVTVLDDGRLVEAVPVEDGSGLVVAAVYDPAFLVPAFAPPVLAFAVVDADGEAVASTGRAELLDVEEEVRNARQRGATAGAVATAPGGARVTAVAPVTGVGPAGRADLTVVVAREVAAPGGEGSPALGRGLLAAGLLAGTAVVVFGLLHLTVVRPLVALQRDAERIAYGDLSRPVVTHQYDEIGSTSRAFERLRLALIRSQVQDLGVSRERRDGSSAPTGEER